MKYLYQQMLGFCIVNIIIILVVGVFFTQLTKETAIENTFDNLDTYSQSIESHMVSDTSSLLDVVTTTSYVLDNQDVTFFVADSERNKTFPQGSDYALFKLMTDEEWGQILEGNRLELTKEITINNESVIGAILLVPFFNTDNNELDGVLGIVQPVSSMQKTVNSITDNLIKAFLLSSIISLIISYFLAKRQMLRIDRIRTATKEITSGNFDVRIETRHKDELDDLAEDFNSMTSALVSYRKEIAEQEELRKQFMANAAHEMRTPLTTINGLLEGIEHGVIPESQQAKCFEMMTNETKRLIRLVNENLDYEKIRANQISLSKSKFDATDALRMVVEQLKDKSREKGNNLFLVNEEQVYVHADYDRFIQIMVNIITNAIQFTDNGEIRVKVEKGYLETIVTVTDTGIGMSEDNLKKIWDRYYKADPSRRNTKYGESGLGLSIVQRLIELHKGRIEVRSKLGEGTSFIMGFPDEV